MSIADKLTYLNGTKSLLRETINAAGGNLTQETPFREYAGGWLRDQSASLIMDFSKQQYVAKDKVSMFPDRVGLEDIVTFTRSTGGGRFNAQGEYEWLPANTPRIDYDPVTGECRGLLIEEQRTRLNTVSAAPYAAQSVAVSGVAQTISFYGSGSVVLSGAHVASLTGAGAYPTRREVTFTPTAGTLTITPAGDVRMLQLEAGAFATSAIAGEGAQVTRAADIAIVNELSPWYNPEQGTLFVESVLFAALAASSVASFYAALQAGPSDIISIYRSNQYYGRAGMYVVKDDTQVIDAQGLSRQKNGIVSRSAVIFGGGRIQMATDGALGVFSDTDAPTVSYLVIGGRVGSSRALNGHIRSIGYYPRKLHNSELQEITT